MDNAFVWVVVLGVLWLGVSSPNASAAPQLQSATITAVAGSDADNDGYYETFSFEFELGAVSEEGSSYDVAARIYCTSTGQGWYTEAWNVAGGNSETVFVVFDQSDFILSGMHSLNFTAEIWDTAFATMYATATAIQGEPIQVEVPGSDPPTGSAPPAPTLSLPTTTSIVLSVNGNGGLPDTLYCVSVTSDPVDPKRNGNYLWPVDGVGQRFDSPVWRTIDIWQNLLVTNPELKPNTTYTFVVRSRYDGVESADSPPASIRTLGDAQVAAPPAPVLTDPTETSMMLSVVGNGGPAETEYSVMCMGTGPLDSAWNGRYLTVAAGVCGSSADAFWATEGVWQSVQLANLQPGTTYTFTARARYEGIESADSQGASLATAGGGQVPSPPAPVLTNPTQTSMFLSLLGNGGPDDTVYCVRITSDPVDPKRDNNYIWPLNGQGMRFDVPVWRNLATWQSLLVSSPELRPGTSYTFVARAKYNGVESADGPPALLSTLGDSPNQCIILHASAITISLALAPAGYPSDTLFAIKCTGTDPTDSSHDQQWLDLCGEFSGEPLWQTAEQWGSVFATGLRPLTTYAFAAKARNSQGQETPLGAAVSARTSVEGDVTGDCKVDVLDLLTIRVHFYSDVCSGAVAASSDLTGDGNINVLDLMTCRSSIGNNCSNE